jgi:transposase
MLTDTPWQMLEPLVEQCRPKSKTPPQDLRRTLEAILWRHQNGAKWRAVPAELGPWWRAAQTFIRWARLGVWERLLTLAQARGVQLGMTFLDGTNVRAHQKAAGAARNGALKQSETPVKRLAALVVAMAPRLPLDPKGFVLTGGDLDTDRRPFETSRRECSLSGTSAQVPSSEWLRLSAKARRRLPGFMPFWRNPGGNSQLCMALEESRSTRARPLLRFTPERRLARGNPRSRSPKSGGPVRAAC